MFLEDNITKNVLEQILRGPLKIVTLVQRVSIFLSLLDKTKEKYISRRKMGPMRLHSSQSDSGQCDQIVLNVAIWKKIFVLS
jgi:hypothetical protein